MSKSYREQKYSWPREYWSKRNHPKCCGWGWFGKLLTHRFERRIKKQEIQKQLIDT